MESHLGGEVDEEMVSSQLELAGRPSSEGRATDRQTVAPSKRRRAGNDSGERAILTPTVWIAQREGMQGEEEGAERQDNSRASLTTPAAGGLVWRPDQPTGVGGKDNGERGDDGRRGGLLRAASVDPLPACSPSCDAPRTALACAKSTAGWAQSLERVCCIEVLRIGGRVQLGRPSIRTLPRPRARGPCPRPASVGRPPARRPPAPSRS